MRSHQFVSKTRGILLANQLQSSGSTFSWVSFPSFFAFQEGMWDTQISALPSSPTVSGGLRETEGREQRQCVFYRPQAGIVTRDLAMVYDGSTALLLLTRRDGQPW